MRKICRIINIAETAFCCTCLAVCMVVLFGNAIARQLGYPIRFANDVALASFAYIAFIGADLAYRNNKLARVELLTSSLPPRMRKALELFVLLISLVLFVLMLYLGVQLLFRSWARPIPSLPNISYGWIIASIPIGSGLMIITTLMKLVEAVKGEQSGESGG